MNRKTWKKVIIYLLCFVYIWSTPLSVYAENGNEQTVEKATEYLSPYNTAVSKLDELLGEKEIYALVYLAEAYAIKEEPDIYSETLASVACGQEVQITGVSEDSGQNIWYEVSYAYDDGVIKGYIERKYLAFSDERLLEWEAEYVQSRAMRLFARRRTISYPDVEQFPESYRDALYELKSMHPDWTFVKMNTGIDWNYAISVECEGSRSLIWAASAKESWKSGMYDKNWAYCTPGIVKYYFDPRNSLTEESVFQFEHLGFNASCNTEQTTQKAVDNTFMSGLIPDTTRTYAKVLTEIGANINISPILLASRIRQEQGTGGNSPLISGKYPGYEGLYNYYNIGATGQTTEAIAVSGLTKARELGWTDRITALSGGATFLLKNYIKRGQDTLYLQKFDVDSRYDGVLWHQYMQNIQAPTTEAKSTYKTYKKTGLLNDMPYVFRIPVFNNMPEYACVQPGSEDKITLSTTSLENLPVNQTAVLTTYINGAQNTSVAMQFTSSDTSVAKVDENGVITGISPGTATITCKKKENPDSANTVTCTVKVVKADISIENITTPSLDEIIYSPNTTLKNISLPQGFAWVDESIVPTVVNSGYSVTYNPDSSKYNSFVLTLPLKVKKAEIKQSDISLPKNLTATAGEQLKSIALPSGFTWEEPDTILPKKTGTYNYEASYCQDVANYEILTGISLSVTVVCKTHEFGEWTGSHADCEYDGKLVRSCNICGEEEVVKEAAKGHTYESKVTKQPTTTSSGIRTFTCKECNDTYTEEIPKLEEAHKHSYTETIAKEATCTQKGEKTFTCSCKDSYKETIEALGHDIVNGACQRCEYVEPSLPSHTHSYTSSTQTATCTKAGVIIYTCGCGDMYTEEIKALGHDMKNGKCTRCDYTEVPPENPPEEPPKSSEAESKPETKPQPSESSKEETKPDSSKEEPSGEMPQSQAQQQNNSTAPVQSEIGNNQQSQAAPNNNQQSQPASNSKKPAETNSTEDKLQTVRINMQESTILNADKLARVRENDKNLQLMLTDDVTWNIDIASIKDIADLNVDMAVSIGKAEVPDKVIETVAADLGYELMSLEHDGEFGFEAVLTIPVKEQYHGKLANLFYYNPASKVLEFIDAVEVSEDGFASFTMQHASDYVIVFADVSLETVSDEAVQEESVTQQEAVEAVSTQTQTSDFTGVIILIAILVLLAVVVVAVALVLKKRSEKEDYFFDEEDDLADDRIK